MTRTTHITHEQNLKKKKVELLFWQGLSKKEIGSLEKRPLYYNLTFL
jgi:hypothetical protein